MKIVALLTIRNEELYLKRCIKHLIEQGIDICVIDNESTDSSVAIAKSFLNKGVIRIEHLPYKGYYDWYECLKNKEKLANEINADWFIHHDADEIRQAPNPFKTLKEGIQEADNQGYNAINFDEFVFIPWKEKSNTISSDYVKEMIYYYYFNRGKLRRVNAWKNLGMKINLVLNGGHRVVFPMQNIYPKNFILKHYIALSEDHLIKKYCKRVYSMEEVKKYNWHKWRASLNIAEIKLPSKELFKMVNKKNEWNKSDPKKVHIFLDMKIKIFKKISKYFKIQKFISKLNYKKYNNYHNT